MPRRSALDHRTTDRRKRLIQAAIHVAGGTVRVSRELGYKTAESVRKFYATDTEVPAEKARDLVRLSGGTLTLQQARPDLYDGLTPEELGYTPQSRRRKGAAQ